METNFQNDELYLAIENDLRKSRRTKEELIKITCYSAYARILLEKENQKLKDEIKKLSKNVQKLNNERGAGRKPLSEDKVKRILELKNQGHTIRHIAETTETSIGVVHKTIKSFTN